ncbi:hypothetical protein COCC4DRAFT_133903 [Bipolaris maydis ATCC 48331]|uniref:Uncharacterized protein n=2 Tax=Cochliobolus heterostrophus TaxID=5016 RepID=M2SQ57_COCH5|nr:uncharacterized protein COCC4DRAFT_133903 [Bipolaris maydis ATCC 48331]EMD87425.1 hypothetical protein COCHEDRAFT_1145041 [Bipolaris maydis C5]KAJ5023288.1 hypothetical protein J3E73DRAFT_426274 [Bipolaris maydis]ENI06625.1 hypothetical protein COCC4DRAFT_133903 [Bipolaris maydis ATCC 48331]KAJ5055961.1 retinol dehydrogenase 12 [Bipolaris maydis]KAJ6193712.1 retinol dehydrogenase 12 [Bipolaris maydis]
MTTSKSFTAETGGLEIAKAYSSQITGKTILITGVSPGGIGEATARAFAHGGASIVIATGRNKARVEGVTKELSVEYPSTKFLSVIFDLASLKDVRRAANEILGDKSIEKIDILVNNAGGMFESPERELTVDGIEMHLAANYLSHFLFTKLLLPRLLAAAKVNPPGATRIIPVGSEAINFSPFRFSDWNFDHDKKLAADERPNWDLLTNVTGIPETTEFNVFVAYGQSKTATALFTVQLNTLLAKEGIFAFSLHPGRVRSTAALGVVASLSEDQKELADKTFTKTIDQGSSTILMAATDPGLNPEKGVWLEDNQLAEPVAWAVDKEKAERLWKLSEEIIAEKLGN